MKAPLEDDAFGHWFAGFADGEGCFTIKRTNQDTYQCRFAVGLRADDAPILREIQTRIGVGRLRFYREQAGRTANQQAQARLEACSKADCVRLVEVFERYPLRAKKARDYAVWREAVSIWCRVTNGKRFDWAELAVLYEALREGRKYTADADLPPVQRSQLRLVG